MIQSLLFDAVSLRSTAVVQSPLNNKNNNVTTKWNWQNYCLIQHLVGENLGEFGKSTFWLQISCSQWNGTQHSTALSLSWNFIPQIFFIWFLMTTVWLSKANKGLDYTVHALKSYNSSVYSKAYEPMKKHATCIAFWVSSQSKLIDD